MRSSTQWTSSEYSAINAVMSEEHVWGIHHFNSLNGLWFQDPLEALVHAGQTEKLQHWRKDKGWWSAWRSSNDLGISGPHVLRNYVYNMKLPLTQSEASEARPSLAGDSNNPQLASGICRKPRTCLAWRGFCCPLGPEPLPWLAQLLSLMTFISVVELLLITLQ